MSKAHVIANIPNSGWSFRNKIINGNFDIWQRGTSLAAGTSGRYLADRWMTGSIGTTLAPSAVAFALGQTEVPEEPTWYHRTVVSSVANAANYGQLVQKIESVRTLAGKTVTASFYAKADTNRNISVNILQFFGTGGSPSSTVVLTPVVEALTSSWRRIEISFDIPSISSKTLGTGANDYLQFEIWFDAGSNWTSRSGIGQQSGTFDIAQVQLEEGSSATPFEERFYSIEENLCMRFYQRNPGSRGQTFPYSADYSRMVALSTQLDFQVVMVPPLRNNPSCSARYQVNDGAVQTAGTSILSRGNLTFPCTGISAGQYLDLLDWYADAEIY